MPEHPQAWMDLVTRRELARWMTGPQGRLWRSAAEEDRLEAAVDPAPDATAARLDVRRALKALPAGDRVLAGLRYEADLTHAQIAQVLGVPEGTAKVRLHRLRARLREELTP